MEKDEKLIRNLLEKGMLTKAPDNFTDKVMMTIAETETQAESEFELSSIWYAFIIIGAFIVSAGVIYFTNKELLLKYTSFVAGIFSGATSFIANIFTDFNISFSAIPGSGLIAGIVFIMLALLAFDRFVFTGRRYAGIFVW